MTPPSTPSQAQPSLSEFDSEHTIHIHDPNVVWLPTRPPRPAPPLLTPEEAVLMLRLKGNGRRTLKHYSASGELRSVRIGRTAKYRLKDVLEFIHRKG